MPNLNIRRLDEQTHSRLRVRAAQHGRSMEEEARQIIRAAVNPPTPHSDDIASWLGARAKARSGGKRLKGDSTDLIREDRDA